MGKWKTSPSKLARAQVDAFCAKMTRQGKAEAIRRKSVSGNQTDLTFFTNDKNQTLLDRFKTTLADTQLFDVLVGYFRSSGFYQLYESIEPISKTRILVGSWNRRGIILSN